VLSAPIKKPNIMENKEIEKWQPKEGDLVWVKFLGEKCTFRWWATCKNKETHPVVENEDFEKIVVPINEIEPYTAHLEEIKTIFITKSIIRL
jgi:hypothetical protein